MNPSKQSGPLLVFHYRHEPPYRVDESLRIDASGQVTLLSAASAEHNLRHRAGTYAAQLNSVSLAQAVDLAAMLATLPRDDNRVLVRHGIDISVVAEINGEKQWHQLNFVNTDQIPYPLAEALRLQAEWKTLATAAPQAVVEVSGELGGTAGQPRLALTFRSVGQQPVRFVLKPALAVLSLEENSQVSEWWQNGAALRTGLIGHMGKLVDGLRTPAEMESGSRAVLSLQIDKALPEGWFGGVATLEGYINLLEPGVTPPTAPETRFMVQAKI